MKAWLMALAVASVGFAALLVAGCSPTGGDLPPESSGGVRGGAGAAGSGVGEAGGSAGMTAGTAGARGTGGSSLRGGGGSAAFFGRGGSPGGTSLIGGRTGFGFPTGSVDAGVRADAAVFQRDAFAFPQRDGSARGTAGTSAREAGAMRDVGTSRRD